MTQGQSLTRPTAVLDELTRTLKTEPPRHALVKFVAILRGNFDHYNWVGIYLVSGGKLVLEAYAGDGETEHTVIPIGQGICGYAAKVGETVFVPDVSQDPRYLMCFPSTQSEIVVPIRGRMASLAKSISTATDWQPSQGPTRSFWKPPPKNSRTISRDSLFPSEKSDDYLVSKFRREEPPSLPKHKHCPVCGTPIDLAKQHCSDKCRVEARRLSRSRTRTFILITGGVFFFYILFLVLQGRG